MALRGRNVNVRGNQVYHSQYQAPKRQLHLASYARPAVVIALLIGVIYLVLFSPLLSINSLQIIGNKQIASSEVVSELNTLLDSSALGRNVLFLNINRLEGQLGERIPAFSSIQLQRTFPHGLLVKVSERSAAMRWKSSSSVFVLSADGRAFDQATKADDKLPIVEDSTNLPVEIGSKIVPTSFVEFTTNLSSKFSTIGLEILSMSVPETTSELYIKSNKGYVIKLDTTRDIDDQLIDLRAVLAKKIIPKEYIDLRIAGKVFYK